MLLYLTSWTEKDFREGLRRSWKGYDFDILNELEDEELIWGGRRSKSVYLGKNAIARARELLSEYGIEEQA